MAKREASTSPSPPLTDPFPTWPWVALLAAVGFGVSAAAAYIHHAALNDPTYPSFCDVGATWSCTDVYLSAYGSFRGMSVAVLGAVWFAGVLGLVAWGRTGDRHAAESAPAYVFAAATIGLAVILYLAYASFFVLGTFCILCLITYAAVIGIFVLSGGGATTPLTSLPGRLLRDLRSLSRPAVLVGSVLFATGTWLALTSVGAEADAVGAGAPSTPARPMTTAAPTARPAASPVPPAAPPVAEQVTAEDRASLLEWFGQQPRAIVPVDGGGADVVVVKFNDYMCPPCGQTYQTYEPIFDRYEQIAPGRVRLVTKHFPLDPECNANAPNGIHFASCEAAAAVLLAGPGEPARRLEQWLFANQLSLTPEAVREAAASIGGVEDFDGGYAQVLEQIQSDIALGMRLGVGSTPTFYINGVKVVGGLQPRFFDALIGALLEGA